MEKLASSLLKQCRCAIKQSGQSSSLHHFKPIGVPAWHTLRQHKPIGFVQNRCDYSRTQLSHITIKRDCSTTPEMQDPPDKAKLKNLIVSSLRLDKIASKGLDVQRKKMELAIISGSFRLNGKKEVEGGTTVFKKHTQVKSGDIIDVLQRKQSTEDTVCFGRICVLNINPEKTKKGRERMTVLVRDGLSLPRCQQSYLESVNKWKSWSDTYLANYTLE